MVAPVMCNHLTWFTPQCKRWALLLLHPPDQLSFHQLIHPALDNSLLLQQSSIALTEVLEQMDAQRWQCLVQTKPEGGLKYPVLLYVLGY